MLRRRVTPALVATVLAAALAVAAGPAPAQADGAGSSGGGSFGIAVNVVVTGGPGDPVAGGSVSVTVPPKCWWMPFNTANFSFYDIDPAAPDAMAQYFKAMRKDTTITFVAATLGWPRQPYLESHQGPGFSWYQLQSAPGVNCADEGYTPSGGAGPPGWSPGSGDIPIGYAAFPGADPAPPLVDVEDVVEEVWDAASAEVVGPQLGRNPVLGDVGGATLVNMPTWFWVQNVQEALAGDGRIHLEVSIPGTPVRATLDAATENVNVSSAVGSTACPVRAAMTEYGPGVAESGACTLTFDRANPDGWTVTGQTTWRGTWEGTDADGPVGGTLQTLTPSATVVVPAVELQGLVTDVG